MKPQPKYPVSHESDAGYVAELSQGFRPYATYRDSGITWLGQVPSHWKVMRLKSLASVQLSNVDKKSVEDQVPVRLCNYVDVYYNEHVTVEIDFMNATATPDQVSRFSLTEGDVLITKDSEHWTDIAVPAVVTQSLPGVLCGYHLAHIRPHYQCHGPFLSRAFAAIGPRHQYHIAANGITRFGLTLDAIRDGLFPLPPLPEQRSIAVFLKRETAKIDTLLAKKERLIELLRERRAALIDRAVTKGLDSSVPMKETGVDWLNEIPVHWNVGKLKSLVPEITVGIVVTPSKYYVESGVPCLRSLNIARGYVSTDDFVYISESANLLHRKSRIFAGDVVVVRTGRAGVSVVVPPELDGANCIDLLIIRSSDNLCPQFLHYYMNSPSVRAQVEANSVGAIQEHFNTHTLSDLYVPVIPTNEQYKIAAFLDVEISRIDKLVATILGATYRLKELRTTLIGAAVTGKIDVSETP